MERFFGVVLKGEMTAGGNLLNLDEMRIAVISDTHGSYPYDLPAKLRSADEIWHLGDVTGPDVLVEFEQLGMPLVVVRGNCDDQPSWPVSLNLKRGGVTFRLEHIPPKTIPPGVRVLLHGHLHVPRDDVDVRGVRWLSPGCISQPRGNGCSFGWLTVADGRFQWQLVPLN